MSKLDLKLKLEIALENRLELLELRSLLTEFRDSGGEKEEALNILEELRTSLTEKDREDDVLDLMDFVVGFCSPQQAIWPSS